MKTRGHVNQLAVKRNKKTGGNEPVLTVKTYRSNTVCHEVEILGPSRIVYSPDCPLSCGVTVWCECECDVKIVK